MHGLIGADTLLSPLSSGLLMQIESESDRAREMSKIDPKLHIFMLHYRKLLRA